MQRLLGSLVVLVALTTSVRCAATTAPIASPARAVPDVLQLLTTTAFLSAGQSVAVQCHAPRAAAAVGLVLDGPIYRAASEELHDGALLARLEVKHLACGQYVMACEAYDRRGAVLQVVSRALRVTGSCDADEP